MLVQQAKSGDLHVSQHATWRMSVNMDMFWDAAKQMVRDLLGVSTIYAPSELLDSAYTKDYSLLREELSKDEVLVLHKGRLNEFDATALRKIRDNNALVFANEVFLIYCGSAVQTCREVVILPEHIDGFSRDVDVLFANGHTRISPLEQAKDSFKHRDFKYKPSVYLGNGVLLSTLYNGQKIYLDGDDISLTPHIAIDGYWETWITKVFLENLKSGLTVVDIGCNCGYFSLLAANAIGPQGRLFCIDANPKMTALVDKSLAVNGYTSFARTKNFAVSQNVGEVQLRVPKLHKGSASIVATSFHFGLLNDDFEIVNVPAAPLDVILENTPVDVMKIDAEGAEPMIIDGAMGVLRNSPNLKIFMEFAPIYMGEDRAYTLLETLKTEGFRISKITHEATVIPFEHLGSDEDHADLLISRGDKSRGCEGG